MKSRLTFRQFSFLLWILDRHCTSLPRALPHYLIRVNCSYPGPGFSAQTYGRNAGWVFQRMPLLYLQCSWFFYHLVHWLQVRSLPIASTCGSLEKGRPQALDLALPAHRKRWTLAGRSPWEHRDTVSWKDSSELWSPLSSEPPEGLSPGYFPWDFVWSHILTCQPSSPCAISHSWEYFLINHFFMKLVLGSASGES